jgi:hypothetical protein
MTSLKSEEITMWEASLINEKQQPKTTEIESRSSRQCRELWATRPHRN